MTVTGQRNTRAHGRTGVRGSSLGPLLQWRDWSIPIKLAAVMLVPVIVAIALGFVVIDGQVATAATYDEANRITALSTSMRAAITALQTERVQVSESHPGGPDASVRAQSDAALAAARQGVRADNGDLDPIAQSAWAGVARQLGELPSVRTGETTPAEDASGNVGIYTQLIGSLLAFDRVLISDLNDAAMTREAMALYDVFSARDEISYQQAVVLAGIGRGGTLTEDDVTLLHGSEARGQSRINDFRAVADPDESNSFDQLAAAPVLGTQNTLLGQAIDQSGGMSGSTEPGMAIMIPTSTWNSANEAVLDGLNRASDDLAAELRGTSATLQDQASSGAGVASMLLFTALLLAAAIMVVVARQLLRSIGVLRRTARDVATRQLPEAVERIRVGETVDVEVTPVPVHTTDEVGQLARAFDAVHAEAVKLAVEQANLRGNYSDLFVNLSRRSQTLVQRQLRLIEQLERDEEDPDQLSALFKLDHLATRMRRNNENLMVLSGSELGRGPSQAVPLADLLRAAVSEIEQYQRVVVQPPPAMQVVGYAAGDLIRLIAELLDNATAFSAPETPVTIASHRTRSNTVVVDIVDHGIGMSDEDLAKANERLSQPEGFEGRVSRRLGLFVVSRLAGQHDVRVRLHGGHDIPGLRVTVTAPAALVMIDPDELPPGGDLGADLPELPALPSGAREPAAADPAGPAGLDDSDDDALAMALTVTIPQLPSASASGVDLFAPLAEPEPDPEPAPPAAEVRDRLAETTPIFDDMLSAWFHDASPETLQDVAPVGAGGPDATATEVGEAAPAAVAATRQAARPETGPPAEHRGPNGDNWQFAADDGWRAVDAVTQSTPETYTTAGLPKRQPKARLLPGSVAEEPRRPAPAPSGQEAEQMRNRLAGFQQGVRRGREESGPTPVAPAGEAGATEHQGGNPSRPAAPRSGESRPGDPRPGESSRPGESRPGGHRPGQHRPADSGPGGTLMFAAVTQPPNGTQNGHNGGPNGRANGNGVNGANGVDGGRDRTAWPTEQPSAAPGPSASHRGPVNPAALPMRGQRGPGQSANGRGGHRAGHRADDLEDTAVWPSAADVGWQAVDEVNRSEPDTYTSAGLPRRQPRARLLPGSVAANELPGGQHGLDPDAVRDRLNSFQRGVRQGRNGSPVNGAANSVVSVPDRARERRHEPAEHGFQWENE